MGVNAQEMLDAAVAAEKAAMEGKSVTFDGMSYSSHNLADLMKIRAYWERRVREERAGSSFSYARFD